MQRSSMPALAARVLQLLTLLLLLALAAPRAAGAPPRARPPPPPAPHPAAAPRAGGPRPEVYGFSVSADDTQFRAYDWSLLTGVGWARARSQIAYAHARGARVELQAQGGVWEVMSDPQLRRAWIEGKLRQAQESGADGINFDLEEPIPPGAQAAADYTSLVSEAAATFRVALPAASISVDVPWSPYDVDGRNYDWRGLAAAADMLFIMAYDTQSQIPGRCVASANAPLDVVAKGVRQWVELGVDPTKLVLGLPWYGEHPLIIISLGNHCKQDD
ncbi:MAG: glycoside hydrolase superfamily [Monoraphidium minutum]|nr:MAG: glycoside hydrolase superfamily [Monoraphidium minutum]